MRRTAIATAFLAVLACTTFAGASAASANAEAGAAVEGGAAVDEARQRFSRGLELYEQRDYEGAKREFRAAYALSPNYRILYNLGVCYGQLGDAASAVRSLEKYLREGGDEVREDRRKEVEKELANLRPKVAYVTVRTNIADCDLQIDDEAVGLVGAEPVMVNAGSRTIWATKRGYYPSSKVVQVAAGERTELAFELRPLPPIPAPTRPRSAWLRRAAPIGAVVVALLVGIVVLVRSRRRAAATPVPSLRPFGDAAATEEPITIEPTPKHAIVIEHDRASPADGARALDIRAAAATDIGRVKPSNQDSFFVDDRHELYVVADGIGGHAGGEIASATAVEVISKMFAGASIDVGRLTHLPPKAGELASAVFAANAEIRRKAAADWNVADMGTTCVAARFCRDVQRLYIAHVGDSRAYRLRNGVLEQLTTDHTMESLGLVGRKADRLSRALGAAPCPEIDVLTIIPRAGDAYLLCSDGLSKMISSPHLAATLARPQALDVTVASLIAQANAAGGKDNITALVLRVEAR
jgi:protein phosphatase